MNILSTIYKTDFSDESDRLGWSLSNSGNFPAVYKSNKDGLTLSGCGDIKTFGWLSRRFSVRGGATYMLKVSFTVNDIADINLSVLNLLTWRINDGGGECPQDNITMYSLQNGVIYGEQAYKCHNDVKFADIQLLLRNTASGSVTWKSVEFCETEPLPERPVRVTASRWNPSGCGTKEENFKKTAEMIRAAGSAGSDLVLLPEFCNRYAYSLTAREVSESVPDGEYCRHLSALAKENNINVAAAIIEDGGDGAIYGCCVIFGRKGEFIGGYRKTHLYWPETMFDGFTPGDSSPVFELDFGRVGVMICYDSWYAESARLLALKGAELILFPNAGYEEKILPARAIDNGVYIITSSIGSTAQIMNTVGETLVSDNSGSGAVITADIDLAEIRHPHANNGGTMNASGAGRRWARNSPSDRIYHEILKEMSRWENSGKPYVWVK